MKIRRTTTYHHYRVNPDGSETDLGEVAYTFTEEVTPPNRTRVRATTEAAMNAALSRRRIQQEQFEAIADAAQED